VLARRPSSRPGRYCIRVSRILARTVSWARLRLARLASDRFRWDQTGDRVQLVRIGREPVDRQPVPRRDQAHHRAADVHVEVVPHQGDGAAELLVGGVQQPGEVCLSEALRLSLRRRRFLCTR
jgi:hypothetical protein